VARGATCLKYMPSRTVRRSAAPLGVIGGSGFARLPHLKSARRQAVTTPYGRPSCALTAGTLSGRKIIFLARHGDQHTIAPHEINYRANIWALRSRGVRNVVAVYTVGGIRADLGPGALAVPDQIIDYTHGRESTFFDRSRGGVRHIDFTHPYCEALRQRVFKAAAAAGEEIVVDATYAATQGPRLESAAEIDRLERDGADMVGMTGMPEASLAREADLCYAAIAVVVNAAAGRGASACGVSLTDLGLVTRRAMKRVHRILSLLGGADGD